MLLPVTIELKQHLAKELGLPADASDDAARELASKSLTAGALTVDTFKELTKNANPNTPAGVAVQNAVRKEIKALRDELMGAIGAKGAAGHPGQRSIVDELLDTRSYSISDGFERNPGQGIDAASDAGSADNAHAGADKSGGNDLANKVANPSGQRAYAMGAGGGQSGQAENPNSGRVDIANPLKHYDTTRKGIHYSDSRVPWVRKAYGDRPVTNGCLPDDVQDAVTPREMNYPSQADKAVAGVWHKFAVNAACKESGVPIPSHYRMTDHDKQIFAYTLHELPFTGVTGWNEQTDTVKSVITNRKMTDLDRKAVLDDSLSGGINAVPIAFDDAVIITPLLNGELFPLVNLVNVTRGRRINGFSMANPTFTWGIASGTTIPLFDTDAFLAAFDTNIYVAAGAMELSLDFEADSPVAVGDIVIQRYGQQALTTLDYVVANGDGTTQPKGVFTTSGVSTVTPDNTTSGPPTVSDYLSLIFTVSKAFRNEADRMRMVFISNDTTYKRSRNMKVDPASPSTDQRLIMGMNVEDYFTFGHPHKVQNDIANGSCAFANLARYRMYRRLGLQVRVEAGGKELAQKNQRMIVVRMRLGGQMELAGAMAKWTTGQS